MATEPTFFIDWPNPSQRNEINFLKLTVLSWSQVHKTVYFISASKLYRANEKAQKLRPSSSSSSSSVGPMANTTDVLQPSRLIVLTLSPPQCLDIPVFADRCPNVSSTRESLVVKGGTMWGRINQTFCLRLRLPRQFRDLLDAANLRHGTHGFTSLPKEGMLRIFLPWKILTASARFEPTNLGT